MNYVMYAVFNFIPAVFLVSACWAFGMYWLAVGILGKRGNWKSGMTYCGIFFGIQLIMNVLLQTVFPFHVYIWNIGLFTIHGVILAVILFKPYGSSFGKIFASVAISHFCLITFHSVFERVMIQIVPLKEEPSFWKATLIWDITPHFSTMVFAGVIGIFLRKMNFNKYWSQLFLKKAHKIITISLSFLLIHLYYLLQFFFPAWAESFSFLVINFILIFIVILVVQLLFFEAIGNHKVCVHTDDEMIEFFASLQNIENQLEEKFFRSHRAFLVNKNRIAKICLKEQELQMDNGEICLLSRAAKKDLQRTLS